MIGPNGNAIVPPVTGGFSAMLSAAQNRGDSMTVRSQLKAKHNDIVSKIAMNSRHPTDAHSLFIDTSSIRPTVGGFGFNHIIAGAPTPPGILSIRDRMPIAAKSIMQRLFG